MIFTLKLGHNLYLSHSSEYAYSSNGNRELVEYGDTSCMMGYGTTDDDLYECFNGVKNFQLGLCPASSKMSSC